MQRAIIALAATLLAACYPLLIFFGLQLAEPRLIGLVLALLFLCRALLSPRRALKKFNPLIVVILPGLICALLSALINSTLLLRVTPAVINYTSLALFLGSLWRPPSMIERFARITEPALDDRGIAYTRWATAAWSVFFFINGSIALYTALYASMATWTLYNGLLAYLAMGLMFVGEFSVRQYVRRQAA